MSHRLSSHYYKHRAERLVGSWMGAKRFDGAAQCVTGAKRKASSAVIGAVPTPLHPPVTKCRYRDGKCSCKVKILLCRRAAHSAEQHVLTPFT